MTENLKQDKQLVINIIPQGPKPHKSITVATVIATYTYS
jgi:hypothetical protein